MKRFQKFLAIIGATSLLVLGINGITEAANGGSFKIGKTNKGTKLTTLKRTKDGAPLALTVNDPAVSPPFTTNATGLVANLNANKINGSSVTPLIYQDTSDPSDDTTYSVTVPNTGTYQVSISAAVIPNNFGPAASESNPIQMACAFSDDTLFAPVLLEATDLYVGDYYASPSATGVLNLTAGSYQLWCATTDEAGWDRSLFLGSGFGPTLTLLPLPAGTKSELN